MFKLLAVTLALVVLEVSSHGMMWDPVSRSSLWHFDRDAPPNYDEDGLYCGGISELWDENNGHCGVCGDNYAFPHPQDNENTGKYGGGKIVKEYNAGQVIEVLVNLTANHLGHFEYHLCKIEDSTKPESGEECFQQLLFEDGSTKYPIVYGVDEVINHVVLPEGFTCEHCVLRWHYRAGNNWGDCEDGSEGMGCGPQEWFRSCSDIRIN